MQEIILRLLQCNKLMIQISVIQKSTLQVAHFPHTDRDIHEVIFDDSVRVSFGMEIKGFDLYQYQIGITSTT